MQDPQDPTMEQALAAIKRVMAEEKELRVAARVAEPTPAPDETVADDEVLELEPAMVEDLELPDAELGAPLVSEGAAEVSRQKLAQLQQVAATAPPPPEVHPLEQMVRDMLRPALKDWLDQNLPGIVEEHVKREIQRITGKSL